MVQVFKGDLRAYFKSKEGEKSNNVKIAILASKSRLVTAVEMSMAEQDVRKSVVEKKNTRKTFQRRSKSMLASMCDDS